MGVEDLDYSVLMAVNGSVILAAKISKGLSLNSALAKLASTQNGQSNMDRTLDFCPDQPVRK